MAMEAKPCHMAQGFSGPAVRKAHYRLLHSIHTCLKSAHWTPAQSLSQMIYLPVLYFLKLEDEGKLAEEHEWLVKSKTITHIHRLISCVQSGPVTFSTKKEGCSGLENWFKSEVHIFSVKIPEAADCDVYLFDGHAAPVCCSADVLQPLHFTSFSEMELFYS